ncbi:MAG: hypothetical protein IJV65_05880 [Kiritimatiellae bacterium]|nr:hypothetical protein [Kiritimatiellia bacterium]
MKKHFLPQGVNWYRANLHCHSTLSDGYWPPARLRTEFKNAGYQILAITDHNVLVDHSDLDDPGFLTLTSAEYDVNDWDSHLPPARPDADPWNYRFHNTIHLNLFSKVRHPAGPPPARDTIWGFQHNCFDGTPEQAAKKKVFSHEAVNEVVAKANAAGFLVQLNHPNWSRNVREDWLSLRGLWGLEILNYGADVNTGGDYCPYVYDDLLNYVDPRIVPTMGDDNHNSGGSRHGTFGGSTFVGAASLDYDSVIGAMERGDLFCASGVENPPRFLAVYEEDGVVHVDCTPVSHVQFVGDGRRFAAKHGEGVTHAEFPLNRNDGWFRVALRDDRGNVANTRAYSLLP